MRGPSGTSDRAYSPSTWIYLHHLHESTGTTCKPRQTWTKGIAGKEQLWFMWCRDLLADYTEQRSVQFRLGQFRLGHAILFSSFIRWYFSAAHRSFKTWWQFLKGVSKLCYWIILWCSELQPGTEPITFLQPSCKASCWQEEQALLWPLKGFAFINCNPDPQEALRLVLLQEDRMEKT